jgi:hypothetical protein
MRWVSLLACAFFLAATLATADEEASNIPRVTASRYGGCYAKSVPSTAYGSEGTTKVYAVRADDDLLLHTFSWYSAQLYLECNVGRPKQRVAVSLVRFGPWARGSTANKSDVAIAFYYGGQLAKAYSTLDIAGSPDNVSASISHYTVFDRVEGYRWQHGNFSTFEVLSHDGRLLVFDPTTGGIVSAKKAGN